jgi:hypothetical protein
MYRCASRWLTCCATVTLIVPSFAFAGTVLLSQQRRVETTVRAVSTRSMHRDASGFGSFDEDLQDSLVETDQNGDVISTISGSARSQQTSNITATSMSLSGLLSADSDDNSFGSQLNETSNLFDVLFRVDRPQPFQLNAFVPFDGGDWFAKEIDFRFTRTEDGKDILGTWFEEEQIQRSGVLAPGTYNLHFFSHFEIVFENGSFGQYQVNLDLPKVAAVPLPPAAWSGLAGLAALCAPQVVRRARRT